MKEYPYNLTDIMRQFTSTPKRYTKQHFDFVRYAFAAVVAAVDEIHSLGYVHRDLKPDNFLGDAECRLYII
jgi:serine/threonine protein kinase